MAPRNKPLLVVVGILLIMIGLVIGIIYIAVEWGQEQQTAVSVVAAGATQFSGTLPQAAPVSYQTKAGTAMTAKPAYPGYVYLYAKLQTDQATVEKAVQANGGSIAASLPAAGLYMIKVTAGQEGAFLTALFKESWAAEGMPVFPLVRGSVGIMDFYGGTQTPSDCYKDHGELTGRKGGRLGGSIFNVDLEKDLPSINNVDVAAKIAQIAEANANGWDRIVVSLSLQSGASSYPISAEDKAAGCDDCAYIQAQQLAYYYPYFQTMEALFKNNPAAADKTSIVIIAGNAGVDLDFELNKLRNDFPQAFARMMIAGGTDGPKIAQDFNYLKDNSAQNMVYSKAKGVAICNADGSIVATCSGTSYAAPEVAAVLDYIWARNPDLTSEQLIDVLKTALKEKGTDNMLPQEGCGTTQAFLDRAVAIAREKYKTGTYAITIKRVGTPYGGFTIDPPPKNLLGNCTGVCTVAYNAGTNITITVHDDEGILFEGWSSDCSGTAKTCTLTLDRDKTAIMHFGQDTVELTVYWKGEGSGTISHYPNAINKTCGNDAFGYYNCRFTFLRGEDVKFTEVPDSGSVFTGWSDSCTGTGDCDIKADHDASVTANFGKEQAPQSPSGGGGCASNADCNTYSWIHCNTEGALCDSNGLCHCNLIQDGFWVRCPCPSGYMCIRNYCGAEAGGPPGS